jgi:competence protein ComEA
VFVSPTFKEKIMSNRLLVVSALCTSLFISPAFSAKLANSSASEKGLESSQSIAKKVDLNQASAIQIANAVNGVGKKRAQAIVDYRSEFGAFKSFDELAKVRGISQAFINKERHQFNEKFYIRVSKT